MASLARAHEKKTERVRVQNLRHFPQTKLDSEINAPFLLNEHGDARIFLLLFAKNSLMKNTFEAGKKFYSKTSFFYKIVLYWVYFGPDEDLKLTKELSKKVKYSRNQAIKNGLNEAILLM